jgi:protocatechuate 3,4-dioxygenase beta subunit
MRRLVVTPLLVLASLAADPALAQRGMHSCAKRPPQGWAIRLAPADAPGERLVLTGTLYAADRKTPLTGITLYVYNTDPSGHYSRDGQHENEPYVCGVLTTGPTGKFRIETVRPASYPGTRITPHVHFVAWGNGVPEQATEVQFVRDPQRVAAGRVASTAAAGDRFTIERPLVRAPSDTLYAVRDLAVRTTGT